MNTMSHKSDTARIEFDGLMGWLGLLRSKFGIVPGPHPAS